MSNADIAADELVRPIKRTDGDTLEERLTANAYRNILPARYLRKDADGNVTESQEELFARVAKNIALAEAVYAAAQQGETIEVAPDQLKPGHPRRDELAAEVFGTGTTADDDVTTTLSVYNVNKFAYDTVVPELPDDVRETVVSYREEFQELMESLSFMPNSPTLMNAGDELQQLSACFVDSPDDDITDIHQTAKEAAEVFQCLTEDARVAVEGKGAVSISDVQPGDSIVQRDGEEYRTQNVDEIHAYDDAPTKRVVTEGGLSIRGTPNHRLLVNGEWTEIDDIEAGDTLSVRLGWLPNEDRTEPLESVARGGQWARNRVVSNEAIAELHDEGRSDYEIAELLDCSASTVQRRRANELDLPPNGTGGRKPGVGFDEGTFADLYEDGHTDSEIASAVGAHTATVQQYRSAQGLESNGEPVKTVTQPSALTVDLAELVGIWVGDGSVHQDGIRFHINREDVLNHVDTLSRGLFDTGIDYTWADGCYEAVIHSHEIQRWWLSNFGGAKASSAEACVPDQIWQAGHDQIHAFLRGLFSTDGTLTKGRYPRLYSSSERLVDETLQLMLGVGIPATKWEWENEEREYFSVAPTDAIGLERFARDVGYVDTRADEMSTSLSESPPGPTQCGTVRGDSTWEQEIEVVEQTEPETVYDVTVADNHEYVANSVVSHNSGGGMGYAFWRLRPYGDAVGSTGGIASGPITFMRTYDQMCETIAQGGARRGAQMGVMRVSHPDVIQFIHAKNKDVSLAHSLRLNDPDDFTHTSFADALEEARELIDEEGRVPKHLRNAVEGHLSNFNISVGVTDDFMAALENDEEFVFTNPRTEEPHVATPETKELYDMFGLGDHVEVGEILSIPVAELWEQIVDGAYENGEPGVIYLERVNKEHSFDVDEHPEHRILATNPCVTGDTLVSTENGLVPAEELYEQGVARDVVVDGRLSEETLKEASSVYKTGEKDVYKLTTEEGYELRLTADHCVMTDDGWVDVADLAAGDTVHIQNRKGAFGRHGTAEEGRVLGWLVGDGHLKHGEERAVLNFYDDDSALSESFATDVNAVVREPTGNANYEVGVSTIDRADDYRGAQAVEQRIRSARLYEYAADAGLVDRKHQVPDAVMRGSEEMARGFLRALFSADGSVQGTVEKGVSVRLCSNHATLLKGVQRLLLNFGIASTVYENRREAGTTELPDGRGGTKAYETAAQHELVVCKDNLVRFAEEIGFLHDEKNAALRERLDEYARGPYTERFEATVESVEADGHEAVYDLTEPDTHSFVANGIVVHNCGEQPLEEYEACNLGHINLSTVADLDAPDWRVWSDEHADEYASTEKAVDAFLEEAIDFAEFDQRIELGTRFLENVVTMSDFPVEKIEQKVREMRKIGLGIMGLAQLYLQLGIRYGSEEGNEVARQLMTHINHESKWASHELADERGSFDDWSDSKYAQPLEYREWFEHHTGLSADDWSDGFPIRNHNTTTIAPTGTTSMIGNTSGGCEPIFSVAYFKNVSDDVQGDEMLVEFDDYFLRVLEANDIDVEAVKQEAVEQMQSNEFDGVDGLSTVPDAIGELFVVTADLTGKEHAAVQCACQKGVDSAISKCIEEGTLVQTDQGLVPIEGFSDNDEPGTFRDVDGEYTIDGYDVTSHYYAGKKPSTRIRLDSGAELVGATESHRVLTPDGWELLSDLAEGDVVLGEFSISHSGGGERIEWSDDLQTSANRIETPDRMSPTFAEFLGMVAADGGAYEETGRVEITTDTMPVEDRYADLCDQLFDAQVAVEYDDRTANVRRVYLTSRNLARCVRSLVGYGAYEKRVPEQVIRGSAEEKLAFVRGLTLDGYNSSNGFTVYGGMSEELAYGTAQLLRSFGVPKVYEGRKWVPSTDSYEHLVTVSNELQDLVSAIEPHKNPEPQFVRYKVPVDRSELSLDDYETGTSAYYAVRSARNRGNRYLFNETAEKLGVEHSGIAYEVTEVEDVGERELYDIEVEDSHRYLVNGMISHNTCNFPNSATREDMDEVYRYIYDNGGKGVTVYRDGTRSKQVLTTRAKNAEFADDEEAAETIVGQIEEVFGGIEGFLDSEEVRAQLEADVDALLGSEQRLGKKRPRPDVLHGVTQRIDTGYGKLYVNINEDERGNPFELFANIGNSGGFTASFTEALAKTISTALRSGVDPEEIASELQGIRSPKVAWDKGEQINSIPDAIGTAMRRYLDGEIDKQYPQQKNLSELEEEARRREHDRAAPGETDGGAAVVSPDDDQQARLDADAARTDAPDATQDLLDAGESPECPECGNMTLYFSEGCKTCESCGWSEC